MLLSWLALLPSVGVSVLVWWLEELSDSVEAFETLIFSIAAIPAASASPIALAVVALSIAVRAFSAACSASLINASFAAGLRLELLISSFLEFKALSTFFFAWSRVSSTVGT